MDDMWKRLDKEAKQGRAILGDLVNAKAVRRNLKKHLRKLESRVKQTEKIREENVKLNEKIRTILGKIVIVDLDDETSIIANERI